MASPEAIKQQAAEDGLKHIGRQVAYTRKGGSSLGDVWAQILRDTEIEREDMGTVFIDRIDAANFLSSEVGRPQRGDTFVDGSDTWEVDQVIKDNNYLTKVAIKEK